MARRKKRYSATKCPEPLNTMIDLAGAIAMGAYAKHKIKKDYQSGQGAESLMAATTVLGMGAMRRDGEGLIALGGLYGVNSALCDIERNAATRRRVPICDDDIIFPTHKKNDNWYAWRLNCEDGSAYGVSPMDYETRDDYNHALSIAKGEQQQGCIDDVPLEEPASQSPFSESPLLCCRVSRLDNGANEYYLTEDENIKVGDTITVTSDVGTSEGIVIGIKRLSEMREDDFPKGNMWILTQEDETDDRNANGSI